MTSITQAFGKLLNTVGTVADTATKIVDNTASGLDMLDMFVSTAKQKQAARTAVDLSTFYEDLQNEAALENAIKSEALEKELGSNPQLKKHFETHHTNLASVIEQAKAKYAPV